MGPYLRVLQDFFSNAKITSRRNVIKSSCKCAAQDEDSTNESCSKIQNTGFLALIVQTLNIASEGQPRLSLSQLKFLTKYVTIFWHNFEWQLSGPGCFFGNFRDTVIWLSELRSFWVGVPGLLSFTLQFRPCKILGHILSFIWSTESKNFVQARNPGSQSQLGAVESRYNTLTSIISKKHSGNVTKFMTPAC